MAYSPTNPAAIIDAESYFQTTTDRHEKGSGMAVIAAEREAIVSKTARLKAAREAQQVAQAATDAEALRQAPPKPSVKRKPKAK